MKLCDTFESSLRFAYYLNIITVGKHVIVKIVAYTNGTHLKFKVREWKTMINISWLICKVKSKLLQYEPIQIFSLYPVSSSNRLIYLSLREVY